MVKDLIGYDSLVQDALRGVMASVLERVARSGAPGDHYFHISFRTDHPGVEISQALRARHAGEMTIVLQHRYWDLEVADTGFAVSLSFNGVAERLSIPFGAVMVFADQSVKFALQFRTDEVPRTDAPETPIEDAPPPAGTRQEPEHEPEREVEPADVVSLDSFRKK
jgi:hypothetical protein